MTTGATCAQTLSPPSSALHALASRPMSLHSPGDRCPAHRPVWLESDAWIEEDGGGGFEGRMVGGEGLPLTQVKLETGQLWLRLSIGARKASFLIIESSGAAIYRRERCGWRAQFGAMFADAEIERCNGLP
jgi:hypothetical protein